jgi:NTP pyrophosphatase (non-canonical NTP hydrolase)
MSYEMSLKTYVSFVCSERRPMITHDILDTELEVLALSNALGGEVGELQNVVKKLISKNLFYAAEHELHDKFVKEAGDALWYLFRIIQKSGYRIEYIMEANINKLTDRYKEGDTWRK